MRAIVCWILGLGGDRSAVGALGRALGDPHPSVRVAAAAALGALGGANAAWALQKAAGGEDAALKVACVAALAAIRSRGGAIPVRQKPRAPGPAGREEHDGYELESIVTGAGGALFCVIRDPDGKVALLREGEQTAQGYVVERILPEEKGGGRVFLTRGGKTVTLEAAPE